jgi:two-component system response regulator NreC
VMDVSMPGMNGVEATREILRRCPRTKVLSLSMHADTRFVREMLKAGASGYLLKDCAFDELSDAIRSVVAGGTPLSEAVAGGVVKDYLAHVGAGENEACALSARERQVLQLIAEGMSTKKIASTLHVSVKTVETHRCRMMDRLEIDSVAGLTKYAIREGITTLDM